MLASHCRHCSPRSDVGLGVRVQNGLVPVKQGNQIRLRTLLDLAHPAGIAGAANNTDLRIERVARSRSDGSVGLFGRRLGNNRLETMLVVKPWNVVSCPIAPNMFVRQLANERAKDAFFRFIRHGQQPVTKKSDEQYSPEETARRGDTLLLQLLKTPPRPREKLKARTKRKPSRAKAASQKPKKSA